MDVASNVRGLEEDVAESTEVRELWPPSLWAQDRGGQFVPHRSSRSLGCNTQSTKAWAACILWWEPAETPQRSVLYCGCGGSPCDSLLSATVAGLPSQGGADALGEPHHGHVCFPGPGDRAAHRDSAPEETLRPQQAAHLQNHDEEHPGPRRLPANPHLHPALRG